MNVLDEDDAQRATQAAVAGLMRPGEVAGMLGVSRSWLYEAAKEGRIPCVRLGGPDGPVRFIRSELVDWLERARAGWRPGESGAETVRRAAA